MKKFSAWFALAISGYALAIAGDWLSAGGDPQRSGWQRYGKRLTAATAKDLKLLWKRQIESPSIRSRLTAPVIIGPTVTHRGVRELAFLRGGSESLYAVDADLGTIFWKVHMATTATPVCNTRWQMPAPMVEPDPDGDTSGDPVSDEDDNDDEPDVMRPVLLLASDGRLHTIRPSDGADITAPIKFLPEGTISSNLNSDSSVVYAVTSDECRGELAGIWAVDVRNPNAKPAFFPMKGRSNYDGVSIGLDGSIYCAIDAKVLCLTPGSVRLKRTFTAPEPVTLSPVPFKWLDRELIVAGGAHSLYVLDAAHLNRLAGSEARLDGFTGRVATWQDPAGVRWIYVAARSKIVAFKMTGSLTEPKLQLAWESAAMDAPGPPAVTHGVVVVLSNGASHATLFALDAASGRQLYSSGDAILQPAQSPELALANGHACVGTTDNSLYCFGLPLE